MKPLFLSSRVTWAEGICRFLYAATLAFIVGVCLTHCGAAQADDLWRFGSQQDYPTTWLNYVEKFPDPTFGIKRYAALIMIIGPGDDIPNDIPDGSYFFVAESPNCEILAEEDGSVRLKGGCTPDAAAREFWKILAKYYPKVCSPAPTRLNRG